ncbi:hypothetical protein GC194_02295 [bacterium]|nr:hypothetical protein [bacterium]
MKQELNPDIIFGSIVRRIDRYTYRLKVFLSTNDHIGKLAQEIDIEPLKIVVNNISIDATQVDNLFVDTTLIDRKMMFIVRSTDDNVLTGELYKLPFGAGNAVKIPVKAVEMLNTFNSSVKVTA